jgi:uncharacterized protein
MSQKYEKLLKILRGYRSILVAYSGGVDSTLVLFAAKEAVGDENVVAVTADSVTIPGSELGFASSMCRKIGVEHVMVKLDELKNEKMAENPPDRCYYCKKELIRELKKIAFERKLKTIVDGTNASDMNDFRPGIKALKEEGIRSPLAEAKITKNEVRKISRFLGLETADKPSMACLASRFPYGSRLTVEGIRRVENSEDFIRKKYGIRILRVRDYDGLARIEVGRDEIGRLLKQEIFEEMAKKLKDFGFTYVTLDLEGYRSGSMNEMLKAYNKRVRK